MHRRHEELDSSGAIHFLAHDGLDLAHDPKSKRHPGVDATGEPTDQTRADHQLVAHELRVGGGLLERCKKVSGSAHGGEPTGTRHSTSTHTPRSREAAAASNRPRFLKEWGWTDVCWTAYARARGV